MAYIPQNGTTLSVDGSEVADIISLTAPGYNREAVETSTLSTTAKTFRPSLSVDYGELAMSIQFNSANHTTFLTPTPSGATQNFGIGFNDGAVSGLVCSFDGFVTTFEFQEANRDDADNIMADLTVKVSGPTTWS